MTNHDAYTAAWRCKISFFSREEWEGETSPLEFADTRPISWALNVAKSATELLHDSIEEAVGNPDSPSFDQDARGTDFPDPFSTTDEVLDALAALNTWACHLPQPCVTFHAAQAALLAVIALIRAVKEHAATP